MRIVGLFWKGARVYASVVSVRPCIVVLWCILRGNSSRKWRRSKMGKSVYAEAVFAPRIVNTSIIWCADLVSRRLVRIFENSALFVAWFWIRISYCDTIWFFYKKKKKIGKSHSIVFNPSLTICSLCNSHYDTMNFHWILYEFKY